LIDITGLSNSNIAPDDDLFVFGDRMYSDGSTAYRRKGDSSLPRLYGTENENTRIIRLTIGDLDTLHSTSNRATHDGYYKIGTIVFGMQIPKDMLAGTRHKFSRELSFGINQRLQISRGDFGIENRAKLNNPSAAFSLNYEYLQSWERDALVDTLSSSAEGVYAIVLDEDNPIESLYLVYNSGEIAPKHEGGDRWSFQVTFNEVD
jgi:hypothetical protein